MWGGNEDYIDGGSGNDEMVGRALGDVLVGFEGSELISSNDHKNTDPDGYKDKIDCGPGEDEAWIIEVLMETWLLIVKFCIRVRSLFHSKY
jgi:hypothetical protein